MDSTVLPSPLPFQKPPASSLFLWLGRDHSHVVAVFTDTFQISVLNVQLFVCICEIFVCMCESFVCMFVVGFVFYLWSSNEFYKCKFFMYLIASGTIAGNCVVFTQVRFPSVNKYL